MDKRIAHPQGERQGQQCKGQIQRLPPVEPEEVRDGRRAEGKEAQKTVKQGAAEQRLGQALRAAEERRIGDPAVIEGMVFHLDDQLGPPGGDAEDAVLNMGPVALGRERAVLQRRLAVYPHLHGAEDLGQLKGEAANSRIGQHLEAVGRAAVGGSPFPAGKIGKLADIHGFKGMAAFPQLRGESSAPP